MPKAKTPNKGTAPGEPIVLVGLPGRLRGELQLENSGTQRMVFRGAEMRSALPPKVTGAARARLKAAALPEEVIVSHRLPSVIVRPHPVKFGSVGALWLSRLCG